MNPTDHIDQALWITEENGIHIRIIDQRFLPFERVVVDLNTSSDVIRAIRDMKVRGAPLIGVAAALGIYLACREEPGSDRHLDDVLKKIKGTRPTAVNLFYALDKQMNRVLKEKDPEIRTETALRVATELMEQEIGACQAIGTWGCALIEQISRERSGQPVRILTHCNAGWLATIKFGTALAPVYLAHEKGIPLHVWVDETRPRNQGARLTAWELDRAGIACSIITDNAGGHLMQNGKVDLVLTGSDRTARNGDSANKIGTYLKALAASDNRIPFYMAVPSSTIDWNMESGTAIPVEERTEDEVHYMNGMTRHGTIESIRITPEGSRASNYGFDITPARLITGLITEKGICQASEAGLKGMFPEKFMNHD
jgi:methylthioribose-1-phosphate isomerase